MIFVLYHILHQSHKSILSIVDEEQRNECERFFFLLFISSENFLLLRKHSNLSIEAIEVHVLRIIHIPVSRRWCSASLSFIVQSNCKRAYAWMYAVLPDSM